MRGVTGWARGGEMGVTARVGCQGLAGCVCVCQGVIGGGGESGCAMGVSVTEVRVRRLVGGVCVRVGVCVCV